MWKSDRVKEINSKKEMNVNSNKHQNYEQTPQTSDIGKKIIAH